MLNLKVEMIILVHFMKAVLVWLLKVRVGQEAYLFLYLMLHVVILFMVQVILFNRLLSLYDILSRRHNSMKKFRRACGVLRVICF